MGTQVLVVQHGEKERKPGDPGLTAAGQDQAAQTARWLANRFEITALWASPLRRAVETAEPLATALELTVQIDARLRERMNWDGDGLQSIDDFLDEWDRASSDRSYVPSSGDSSQQAAARFLDAITDIVASTKDGAVVAVVAHGGVTVDTLRTVLGDELLQEQAPELIPNGVPCGAVTVLERRDGAWRVEQFPSTRHMNGSSEHRPA